MKLEAILGRDTRTFGIGRRCCQIFHAFEDCFGKLEGHDFDIFILTRSLARSLLSLFLDHGIHASLWESRKVFIVFRHHHLWWRKQYQGLRTPAGGFSQATSNATLLPFERHHKTLIPSPNVHPLERMADAFSAKTTTTTTTTPTTTSTIIIHPRCRLSCMRTRASPNLNKKCFFNLSLGKQIVVT